MHDDRDLKYPVDLLTSLALRLRAIQLIFTSSDLLDDLAISDVGQKHSLLRQVPAR